jgi:hypothetical protein
MPRPRSADQGERPTSRAFPAGWRGVPVSRGAGGLLLPPCPRRAFSNGLGLIDAYTPVREALVAVARGLNRLSLARLSPLRRDLDPKDREWLVQWLATVGDKVADGAATMAVMRHTRRLDLLLMDSAGVPLVFVKVGLDSDNSERMAREAKVMALLRDGPTWQARVPELRMQGELAGRPYSVYQPLPDGPHRRPPPDPALVERTTQEIRERLSHLPRAVSVPAHHVPGHGDFTHRNLRLGNDGSLWLIDWEYAEWMPPLADELRYWAAHYAFSVRPRPSAAAHKIAAILRSRGTDADIAEAVAWPEFNRPAEKSIRDALGALVAGLRRAR